MGLVPCLRSLANGEGLRKTKRFGTLIAKVRDVHVRDVKDVKV